MLLRGHIRGHFAGASNGGMAEPRTRCNRCIRLCCARNDSNERSDVSLCYAKPFANGVQPGWWEITTRLKPSDPPASCQTLLCFGDIWEKPRKVATLPWIVLIFVLMLVYVLEA